MNAIKRLGHNAIRWIDSEAESFNDSDLKSKGANARNVNWQRIIPFFAVHLTCLFVFVVGWSPVAIIVCLAMFFFWLNKMRKLVVLLLELPLIYDGIFSSL